MPAEFTVDESFALEQDRVDPLRSFRERFVIPRDKSGRELIYLCGNSLGLMPKSARKIVEQELTDWENLAVEAHFHGQTPWYSYHENLREPAARLVGALPNEVVVMNSLTVNLHLMMQSFYRPTKQRFKILMEDPAFPSDTYAIKSQIVDRGFRPEESLVLVKPRGDKYTINPADIEAAIEKHRDQLALVLFGGVNFFTGQVFDIPAIVRAAHRHGITVGIDLAHAAGNIPVQLHDWNVDFAVWCSYKYLNSGPGAVAGAFVHERHAKNANLPRLAGWWGNDPKTRFRMHLQPDFVPVPSADAWQISNPPIFSMAPVLASLRIFDEAGGVAKLREKSKQLTGYLQFLIAQNTSNKFTVITPNDENARGCQLSILVHEQPKELFAKLESAGVKCDFREPNVIRAAPTPLYNTFHEVWKFAQVLLSS